MEMNFQQNEFSSFKLLLKQVYSAHASKVRELENEVKDLKEKLVEKVRERNNVSDCKRCAELEEAFKSCKKALHEQSKWFETFGQKFSIFNGTEQESQDLKFGIKAPNNKAEAIEVFEEIKSDSTLCDKNKVCKPFKENISKANDTENVFSNQNLLEKVMLDAGSLGTLDLYTVTFPENLKNDACSRKSDIAILAPDSLDIDHECKKGVKRASTDNLPEEGNSKKSASFKEPVSGETSKVTSKRLSPDHLKKDTFESSCKSNRLKVDSNVIKSNNSKSNETIPRKSVVSATETKHVTTEKCKNSSLNEDIQCPLKNRNEDDSDVTKSIFGKFDETIIQSNVPPNIGSECVVDVKDKGNMKDLEQKELQIPKKKKDALEVISSDNKAELPLRSSLSLINNVKKMNVPCETSPSLLPTNANSAPKKINLELVSNDNDDFVELTSSNKPLLNEESRDTCDKRKTTRKKPMLKSLKCTSKFKMMLHSPPLNYKKPNFKQVKLSKSFFQAGQKNNSQNKNVKISPTAENETALKTTEKDNPTIILEEFETSIPCDDEKPPTPVDFDATCIPDNYKYEVTPCGTSFVKRNAVDKSHLRNGSLFANISFPEDLKSAQCENSDIEEEQNSPSLEEDELKENDNSFDRLPIPEEPNYKYKNEVVRKKSERKQLNAYDCKECEKYYSELGIPDKEKKERMKKCSRHRAKFAPPATPDHFWELDFPDTQECKARGYMNETQKVKLKNICNV